MEVELMKQSLSMMDIIQKYSPQSIKHNRCRCPLHNGNDYNLSVYDKSFYCWVCHSGGDFIKFVSLLLNISYAESIRQIDDDFNLRLFEKPDMNTYYKRQKQISELKKSQQKKEETKQKLIDEIKKLCIIHRFYNDILKNYKGEEPDRLITEAYRNIEYVRYKIEVNENKLCQLN